VLLATLNMEQRSNCVVTFMSNNNKLSKYRAKRDFTRTAEPSWHSRAAASERPPLVVTRLSARCGKVFSNLKTASTNPSWEQNSR
jgi:hypothetical protein